MTIVDDGVGFDPAHANSGKGLRYMRERATSLPGNLNIFSAAGRGTTVTVLARIP